MRIEVGIRGIILAALVVIAVAIGVRWWFPVVERVIEYETAQVDENTWVQRSVYESERQILRDLRGENSELADQLRGNREQIANLTQIRGYLNTQLDSLRSVAPDTVKIRVIDGVVADTTITFTEYFGNELFQIDSRVRFWGGYLDNTLTVTQLRPIQIDLAVTMSKDQSKVYTYVSTPDFSEFQYQTTHSIRGRKLKGWHYMLIGAGVVVGAQAIF